MFNALKRLVARPANGAGDSASAVPDTAPVVPHMVNSNEVRPLVRITGDGFPLGTAVDFDSIVKMRGTAAYAKLQDYFRHNYPPRALMSEESRAILFTLIRLLRPKVVVEIGTLFAGTTEVMARALWENGEGVIHTTDPFGADRCPGIIAGWPQGLRDITFYYPFNSMEFFDALDSGRIKGGKPVDMALVDGNHDFEFALFDLQMAARLLRPGGVIVMDNAEQIGPYEAVRTFLSRHPAWRELGNAVASFDPANPFASADPGDPSDYTRTSLAMTTFVILKAPDHQTIDAVPHSFGQAATTLSRVDGFALDLPPQVTAGTLFYQVILRAFGSDNRDVVEMKSLGSIRLDLGGPAMTVRHRLAAPLISDMQPKYHDAHFTFEVSVTWTADRGAPPLSMGTAPVPLSD